MRLSSFLTRVKQDFWNIFDFFRNVFFYYKNKKFRQVDLALLLSYLGKNPYRISKEYLLSQNEDEVDAYGETPLTTLETIVKQCELKSSDTLYELGCGRGRTCFWLAIFLKAKIIGIDFVPTFIEKAKAIATKYSITNVEFIESNFLNFNFHQDSIIYLHGTCMSDEDIEKFLIHLKQYSGPTKAITVSFSFTDYENGKGWKLVKKFPAQMSWGDTEVYYLIKHH